MNRKPLTLAFALSFIGMIASTMPASAIVDRNGVLNSGALNGTFNGSVENGVLNGTTPNGSINGQAVKGTEAAASALAVSGVELADGTIGLVAE